MESQDLKDYKEKLGQLTAEEQKQRDLYLKGLAAGTIQGPEVGYSSIDKTWLQYYEDEAILSDVPEMTALNYMRKNNEGNENNAALNFFGIKTSYKQLFEKIDETAKALVNMGVKAGDTVSVVSVTLPQTVYLLYALNKIGAIADFVDPRTDANGMKHYLNERNSKLLFTIDGFYEGFKDILNETGIETTVFLNPTDTVPLIGKIISDINENKTLTRVQKIQKKEKARKIKKLIKGNESIITWDTFLSKSKGSIEVAEKEYEKNYPLAIVHTSGTTSMPKSVVLTNDNFNAMALQYGVSDFKYEKNGTLLNIIPIFVAYGVVNSLHMPLCLGLTNIVYPKVVGKDFTDILMKFKPNHVIAVPMHWEYLLNSEKADGMDLSFLRTAACGGDKLNIELENNLNEFLKKHNSPNKIVKGYGMTEISACAVTNTKNTSKVGSVGIPLVKNNISIIDPETGMELPIGEKGEICIQSPTTMLEYLNNEKETSEVLRVHDDGKVWVHSGDLGHFSEDGMLDIDGRLKRLIIRRGFKVSAVAIENVIMQNEKIESCAVVKAPHQEDGEVPLAYIVVKPEYIDQTAIILEEVEESCKNELPEYSVPSNYLRIDELPYTRNGKLDQVLLEAMAVSDINQFAENDNKQNKK